MTDGGSPRVAVLGAGLAGSVAALRLARAGCAVDVYDRAPCPVSGASLHNEGKLHLGYVYAADPEARTHAGMFRGSLTFLPILAELTGRAPGDFASSTPFFYGVPHDSQLSPEAVEAHFSRVDDAIAERPAQAGAHFGADRPAPSRRLREADWSGRFSPDRLAAVFATDERSADTAQIARAVSRVLEEEPGATLLLETEVVSAQPRGAGYAVRSRTRGADAEDRDYDGVLNALWDDRLRIDAGVGIEPPRPWLMRYKASITIEDAIGPDIGGIPSATFITGAYGDIVNRGGGRFYLSWYPACKLAETTDADARGLYDIARAVDAGETAARSLAALAAFAPGVASLEPMKGRMRIGGGVIFAWGRTDIDDPASGLHRRYAIGPERRGRWVTLDTGKYCTAPVFGTETADMLLEALA